MQREEQALQFISSDDRETWVMIGMALKSEYGEAARDIWMDWSRQSDSFKEADARAVWRSFRGTGVSIASLYHEAKLGGWRDVGHQKPSHAQIEERKRQSAERASIEGQQRVKLAQEASRKAEWILKQCKQEQHAYLDSKGFKEHQGLVWRPEQDKNLLCIPMYVGQSLKGCQLINIHGEKKFLSGQITSMAEHCFTAMGRNAQDWWVEGYASGLSLMALLSALKLPYRIHICFSAGNLQKMAHSGYVVADCDASDTGRQAAIATGLPYFMPDKEGTDINDLHKELGTFRCSQELRAWMKKIADEKEYYA